MHMAIVYEKFDKMEAFMKDVFVKVGLPEEDAKICADVLIESDKRGIESHGIGRFKPIYIDRIKAGILHPVTKIEIVRESPTTAVIDGNNGMGHVIAKKQWILQLKKPENLEWACVS
ncbi:oxidoreductase-related [Holotrichia oblita]|nr:oxidoreductase-related [Holotrichia oblita]